MLLWSGGLDSTWTLKKLNDQNLKLDVVSIVLTNHTDVKRSHLEQNARHSIKNYFPKHNYYESTLTTGIENTTPTLDTINCLFIAAQYARSLKYDMNDLIYMGANSDDDNCTIKKSLLKNRIQTFKDVINVIYRNTLSQPKVTWISPEPSRLQQIKDLGKISNITWSCRNPKNETKCINNCVPCNNIEPVRNLI